MAMNLDQLKNEYFEEIRIIQNSIIKFYERPFLNRMIYYNPSYPHDQKIRIIELLAKIELINFLTQENKIQDGKK